MWRQALGLPAIEEEIEETKLLALRFDCDSLDLITDELFLHDVQNVADDSRFYD
jgi:hypothetical protein